MREQTGFVVKTGRQARRLREVGLTAGAVEYAAGPRFKALQALKTQNHECLVGWVIEGDLEIECGGDPQNAPAGAMIYIPRDCQFSWRNYGARSLSWVCFRLSGAAGAEISAAADSLRLVTTADRQSESAWGLFNGICEKWGTGRKAS